MFNARSLTDIRNEILNAMQNALAKNEGTYNFDIAGSTALGISSLEEYIEWLQLQLFPWTVTDDYYLDLHMQVWNLTRRTPTYATGAVTFTGEPNTNIQDGTIVISRLGVEYKTLTSVIIGPTGTADTDIESLTAGPAGNCAIGDITTLQISIVGVDSVTNADRISGGFEIESIESCKERMREKASLPAHSGNKNDYYLWSKEVSGVGEVEVVGAGEHGVTPGNVNIYITDYQYAPATPELITDVQDYLNTKKPVNDNTTVFSKSALNLSVAINTVTVMSGKYTKAEYIAEVEQIIRSAISTGQYVIGGLVSIPRTISLVMSIEGTIDLNNLTINGGTSNIPVAYNQIPVLVSVVITNYVES